MPHATAKLPCSQAGASNKHKTVSVHPTHAAELVTGSSEPSRSLVLAYCSSKHFLHTGARRSVHLDRGLRIPVPPASLHVSCVAAGYFPSHRMRLV